MACDSYEYGESYLDIVESLWPADRHMIRWWARLCFVRARELGYGWVMRLEIAARFEPSAVRLHARLPAAATDLVSEGWAFESLWRQPLFPMSPMNPSGGSPFTFESYELSGGSPLHL